MTLEEIKQAIVERVDAAWTDIKDEIDADKVRAYVQGLTAELVGHVYAIEAHLVNHVLGKQDTPAPAPDVPPAEGQSSEPSALTTTEPGAADTGWSAAEAPADSAETSEPAA